MSVQKSALWGRVAISGLLAVAAASPAHAENSDARPEFFALVGHDEIECHVCPPACMTPYLCACAIVRRQARG